jgi:predicted peptidase
MPSAAHRSNSLIALCTLILLALLTQAAPAESQSRNQKYDPAYQRLVFNGAGNVPMPYGWLAPLGAKPGEKYPLVICLHDAFGRTRAGTVLARDSMRERYPAFVMVPEADRPFTWAKADVIRDGGKPSQLPQKMPLLIEAVRSVIQKEAIDPTRIYVTGQSMGGVGVWGAIWQHPGLFAAGVPVCGLWRIEEVPKLLSVPVWAFHGERDTTIPVHYTREIIAAITKAGGNAKYTEYPGVGHDSWTKAYDEPEMWRWLFAQRKRRGQ